MATKIAELKALLYVAGDNGLTEHELCQLLQITSPALRELSQKLAQHLNQDEFEGLQLKHIENQYKLLTKSEVSSVVMTYFQDDLPKALSQSAFEILSIIAYRQPITRIEIDELRGVNSSGALQTLIWRGLIAVEGKKDVAGRPNLYVTTPYFLQYFGYQSLSQLPDITHFESDGEETPAGQIDLFESKGKMDNDLSRMENQKNLTDEENNNE